MISDEPDEDANTLDDEDVMDTLINPDPRERDQPKAGTVPRDATNGRDWPPSHPEDVASSLDMATVAWFQSNHADWRWAMSAVLNAWVEASTHVSQPAQPES